MAQQMGIDLSGVPVVLADSHPNSDLSIFSGTLQRIQDGTTPFLSPSISCPFKS